METILRYVIIAAVGALASILANQSIAVFNDGLRPVLPLSLIHISEPTRPY